MIHPAFHSRDSVAQVEEGVLLAPRFDTEGLIPVVTTEFQTGEVLMHAFMNRIAMERTLETGEAPYYLSSRVKYLALRKLSCGG